MTQSEGGHRGNAYHRVKAPAAEGEKADHRMKAIASRGRREGATECDATGYSTIPCNTTRGDIRCDRMIQPMRGTMQALENTSHIILSQCHAAPRMTVTMM